MKKVGYQDGLSISSVDELADLLQGNERLIFDRLRSIVVGALEGYTEKLSYNVPFYYGKRRICFIWPCSMPWGKVPDGKVRLGFTYGNLLMDDGSYLKADNRRQVMSIDFGELAEIDEELLISFLQEAMEVDRQW